MNYELLRRVMEKKGVLQKEMADYLGIKPGTWGRKMRGKSEFTLSEINKISEILLLENREVMLIFFGQKVSYRKQRGWEE